MTVIFPRKLLREEQSDWFLMTNTMEPGGSFDNVHPIMRLDGGGYWICQMDTINLRTSEHIRLWRSIAGQADGGAATVLVPMCDTRHNPHPIVDGRRLIDYGGIPHSDDTLHSDGTGYWQPTILGETSAAADLRDTLIQVLMTQWGPIGGGEYFSIEHPSPIGEHLYMVTTVGDGGDGAYSLGITPPLRDDVPAGTVLKFERQACLMRLADPEAMRMTLRLRKYATTSVRFIEVPEEDE